MDFWIGTLGIFVLATIQILIGGWLFGADNVMKEASVGSILKIPSFYKIIIKYISPAYLLIVFISWLYQKLPGYIDILRTNTNARFTFFFIIILSAFFILLIAQANRNWKKLKI
ncbi:MAG: hypothetical protein KatS3mg129_0121 [Leptospiraceae bacterium]|nr:MAG: hypothetical protein KatS3mg129_0121 [Leptospiraceae bacterium]